MRRHVVLIGLPGAGKTTVGRLAGAALDAPFIDVDEEIERRTGRSVPATFADRGEAAFRGLEREIMTEVLAGTPRIVAPGGGWAAQPGALDAAAGRALVVHLRVSAKTALGRLRGGAERPLLAGVPERRLRELATARSPYYGRAEAAVETEGRDPGSVAAEVAALARSQAEW